MDDSETFVSERELEEMKVDPIPTHGKTDFSVCV